MSIHAVYARKSLNAGIKIGGGAYVNQELELSLNMAFARAREHRMSL